MYGLCSPFCTGSVTTICNGLLEISWLVSPFRTPSPRLLTLTRSGIGITVGAVVVPQGMAYALLANLKPQFGLYSSFMGVLIYWMFATSKDITIGVRPPHLLACLAAYDEIADQCS